MVGQGELCSNPAGIAWLKRYIEPYGGLAFLVEWPSAAKDYFLPEGELAGYIRKLPPRTASGTLGAAIIPWENRARFQRFALDVRFDAAFITDGHDYTPLFDALGTSTHENVQRQVFEGRSEDTRQPLGASANFYGLTDVQSRLRYGARAGLEMQAAKYVRFTMGAGLRWQTPYTLTFADACRSGVNDSTRKVDCGNGAIVNPHHRATIDLPGRRFWLADSFIVDLYASAVAQF